MNSVSLLQALFAEILKEVEANPDFAARLLRAIPNTAPESLAGATTRRLRRPPAVIDPFEVYANGGETPLREALGKLDVEQLKDVVAEHGMDQAKLALKWKTPERLIDLIVTSVSARSRKGDAFRAR